VSKKLLLLKERRMCTSSIETENLPDRGNGILAQLAKGYYDKEIAEEFFLSVKTVRMLAGLLIW
jgi:DNA-binding NarL/FixJ family response regulator